MDVLSAVRRRRMTRRFVADRPVSEADLLTLLELAGRAPSAGFAQGSDWVVLRSEIERERFWAAATPAAGPDPSDPGRAAWLRGVRAAPVLVVALADETAYRRRYAAPDKGGVPPAEQDWPVPYWLTDTAMGAMLLLLGATDLGLGALFFGVPGPRHTVVKAALDIPPDRSIVGVIALGHEERRVGGSARRRARRSLADYTHWGAFGVAGPAAAYLVGDNAGQTSPRP